jgi:hypothetical protein
VIVRALIVAAAFAYAWAAHAVGTVL